MSLFFSLAGMSLSKNFLIAEVEKKKRMAHYGEQISISSMSENFFTLISHLLDILAECRIPS